MPIFFLLIFLFEIEEPILDNILYPEPEFRKDIKKRIIAVLKVKMEIDEEGFVREFKYLESENIEKERVDYFFNFFKNQILGKKIKPMKKNGKPIKCTYIYSFSWLLYYPPPETHFISSNGKKKILKTPMGVLKEKEVYEKEIKDKAIDILKGYGLYIASIDGINYYSTIFFKEIENLHFEIKEMINYFIKIYRDFLDENLNFEHDIYIFPAKKVLKKFLKDENLPSWADGVYIDQVKAIFLVAPHEENQKEILLHEELHFLFNTILFKGRHYPNFLREGFAEAFLEKYKEFKREKSQRWKEYKLILKGQKFKENFLQYLIFWEENGKEESKKFYSLSWAFLKFLEERENFKNFIIDLKENGFSKEMFEDYFGNWEGIELEFKKFLKERLF